MAAQCRTKVIPWARNAATNWVVLHHRCPYSHRKPLASCIAVRPLATPRTAAAPLADLLHADLRARAAGQAQPPALCCTLLEAPKQQVTAFTVHLADAPGALHVQRQQRTTAASKHAMLNLCDQDLELATLKVGKGRAYPTPP